MKTKNSAPQPPQLRFLPSLLLAAVCLSPLTVAPELAHAQNLPTLGDTEREDLSPLAERKLGEQIMNSVRRDSDYVDDGPVNEYLNKLGTTLLQAHPEARGEANFDFEFFAMRDPEINAFAFPGGFIGMHTGLILTAQTESELASVLGHEIGHVSQRHIARMLGSQKYDSLIPMAAMALAVLAARSSPDAAMALVVGGQGAVIQKQLAFSRDAEREADRVGFSILKEANFDPTGMVTFFGRLQASSRNFGDAVPAFLRSHPLTSERIADIQSRTLDLRYKQHADSLEFLLTKARVRVLQNNNTQGLINAKIVFENELKAEKQTDPIAATVANSIAAKYGLAFANFKQKNYAQAQNLMQQIMAQVEQSKDLRANLTQTCAFASLSIDLLMAQQNVAEAIHQAEQARHQLPWSKAIARQYAEALIAANRGEEAAQFLREQILDNRKDASLQNLLAKAYSSQGKIASMHVALAQAYALSDSYGAALEQLAIARKEKDAQYFDLAVIDALEREWQDKRKEEMKEERRNR